MPDGDRLKIRVSAEGEITLPKSVVERHGWTAGTELEIADGPNGVVVGPRPVEMPSHSRPEEVFGMLKKYYSGPPKTIEEMNAGIEAEARRQHARGRY